MMKDNSYSMYNLLNTVQQCQKCNLCNGRNSVVFGEGKINPSIMFIGEGPGYDEDIQGRPFVGRSGQLLIKMIEKNTKYNREDIYITNIVKCRPPNNRNPEFLEISTCLPYLNEQIRIVNPKIIVLLGAVAFEGLIGMKGITKHRGQWFEYKGIKVIPTFHPSYLLRFPIQEKYFLDDLEKIVNFLKVNNIY